MTIDLHELQARIEAAAAELGREALQKGLVYVTAESCTAGGVSYAVTQIAGSSAWFDRGFVTYTNEAKQQLPIEKLRHHNPDEHACSRTPSSWSRTQPSGPEKQRNGMRRVRKDKFKRRSDAVGRIAGCVFFTQSHDHLNLKDGTVVPCGLGNRTAKRSQAK